MRLHIVGAVPDHLIQLHDGQIFIVVLGIIQRLVVALHVVRANPENGRLPLHLIQIMIRQIVLRHQIHADHPLHQRVRRLTALKKNEPQQIPGILLVFVILQ